MPNGERKASFPSDMLPPLDPVGPIRRVPKRGYRKRVLGSGEGDFCIYVISDGNSGLPLGALVPIDGVPHFTSSLEAKRWILEASGNLLVNKQIMVFRAVEIINVVAKNVPTIELQAKVKFNIDPNSQEEP
jgi:hypothetical protein